ncbi:hypothetical protein N7520_002246 [Penicillium odoratum]|uniref:uncharacterized protein n=1 Tax=Penicillium odoratum TaxID=1167516 RepID=UPI002547879C|nr:uncharacterized protein N7520_002246 [Penicillium odoratum]KAJ5771717.1 hypothetical protein N7520_002246 [Penicillium odoratum]
MPFRQSNFPVDDRYLQLSPQSRPMDMFKTSDNFGNWSYDSAIDLFSLTPAEMDPVFFDFDSLTGDTKDLFMDPFGTSSAINGFTMPTEDTVSMSSDVDSDDQSWSMRQSLDMTAQTPSKSTTRSSTQTSQSRWSSSPEIKAQEYAPREKSTRKTRSLSQDSNHSTQDPQVRNAAKRAAHNIIEKRYRTNMNTKFLSLEKAISPAGVHKQTPRAGAGSLKKSEILTNALAYIESIQQENQAMQKELAVLKQNLVPNAMWRHKQPRA